MTLRRNVTPLNFKYEQIQSICACYPESQMHNFHKCTIFYCAVTRESKGNWRTEEHQQTQITLFVMAIHAQNAFKRQRWIVVSSSLNVIHDFLAFSSISRNLFFYRVEAREHGQMEHPNVETNNSVFNIDTCSNCF